MTAIVAGESRWRAHLELVVESADDRFDLCTGSITEIAGLVYFALDPGPPHGFGAELDAGADTRHVEQFRDAALHGAQ
jgi:hypothetical protein